MHLSPATVIYSASVVGMLSILALLPRKDNSFYKTVGTVIGAATLGGFWIWLHGILVDSPLDDASGYAFIFYYIFSALGIVSAVKVITHTRPVYSALWFVMVVLSTSGLLLTLGSEFMAFAMIIIYGGAILVTYVFVIMLASQSSTRPDVHSEDAPETLPPAEYDAIAREPIFATFAGFLLLAVLVTAFFSPLSLNHNADADNDKTIISEVLTNRPANRLANRLEPLSKRLNELQATDPSVNPIPAQISSPDRLDNVERVGLDLFRSHPLGLELAGIILLVSLVGAVVIARKRVEPEKSPIL